MEHTLPISNLTQSPYSHHQIYRLSNLEIVNTYNANDSLINMEWSPDSTMILLQLKKNTIAIISIIEEYKKWECVIKEGIYGLQQAFWLADSLHIGVVSDFNIRMTIYSLSDQEILYIANPKNQTKGHCFSPNKKYIAILEKHDTLDCIGIYRCRSFQLVKIIKLETNDNFDGILWSLDGYSLICWESIINHKLVIYSIKDEIEFNYSKFHLSGLKRVAVSPDGLSIVFGSNDEKIRVINQRPWNIICELEHPLILEGDMQVYKEVVDAPNGRNKFVLNNEKQHKIKKRSIPEKIDKMHQQVIPMHIQVIEWSYDSHYLAVVEDSIPNVVWIWDMHIFSLKAVMILFDTVKSICWSEKKNMLFASSEKALRLYCWCCDGVKICDLPNEMKDISNIQLNWCGECLVVSDKVYI